MRNIRYVLLLTAAISLQPAFANEDMTSSASKPCEAIANACLNAGFTRADTSDKQFWQNCMRQVLLGKSVQGIDVDGNTAKMCRAEKIKELKNELQEFQSASSKK